MSSSSGAMQGCFSAYSIIILPMFVLMIIMAIIGVLVRIVEFIFKKMFVHEKFDDGDLNKLPEERK